MKISNSEEFKNWAYEQVQKKGYSLEAIKGKPPFPMFRDDGSEITQINLEWLCPATQEKFTLEYEQ